MTNKDIVSKFVHAINDRDIDTAVSCVADDLVNHAAIPEAQGAKGLRAIFSKLIKAMPDMRSSCEDLIAEGDRVVCRMTMHGTHTGPLEFVRYPLAATGKSARVEQIHIYRLKDGKIVEHWAARDDLGMLRQLGVLPFGAKESAA